MEQDHSLSPSFLLEGCVCVSLWVLLCGYMLYNAYKFSTRRSIVT
jgi:hypothetical protein